MHATITFLRTRPVRMQPLKKQEPQDTYNRLLIFKKPYLGLYVFDLYRCNLRSPSFQCFSTCFPSIGNTHKGYSKVLQWLLTPLFVVHS